ncbi:MAG TPA: hypothetical protein VGB85_04210 [Nannocystis sp.]|jgi:hypothetical protein
MTPTFALALCLSTAAVTTREPPSDLSPAARVHNHLGIAHIEAGAYATGVDELDRAYMLMPDPLQYRAGRSKVLGSIRSALNHLYRSTGDPAYLRRLQTHLLRHLEALLLALGDTATIDDTAGSLAALREVEQTLARHPVVAPAVVSRAAEPRRVPVVSQGATVPPPARPESDLSQAPKRRMRLAGGILLGAGVAAVGVSIAATVASLDNRNKLHSLARSLLTQDTARSLTAWQEGQRLYHRERDYQTVAILTGVAGGVMLATGVALRVLGKRRPSALARHHILPTRTTNTWALVFTGEF